MFRSYLPCEHRLTCHMIGSVNDCRRHVYSIVYSAAWCACKNITPDSDAAVLLIKTLLIAERQLAIWYKKAVWRYDNIVFGVNKGIMEKGLHCHCFFSVWIGVMYYPTGIRFNNDLTDQRRSSQEDGSLFPHNDALICHGRYIRPSSGTGAHNNSNL